MQRRRRSRTTPNFRRRCSTLSQSDYNVVKVAQRRRPQITEHGTVQRVTKSQWDIPQHDSDEGAHSRLVK